MAVLNHLKFPIEIDEFGDKQEYTIVLRRRTAQEYNQLMNDIQGIEQGDIKAQGLLMVEFFNKLFIRIDDLKDANNQPIDGIENVEENIKLQIVSEIMRRSTISLKNSSGTST